MPLKELVSAIPLTILISQLLSIVKTASSPLTGTHTLTTISKSYEFDTPSSTLAVNDRYFIFTLNLTNIADQTKNIIVLASLDQMPTYSTFGSRVSINASMYNAESEYFNRTSHFLYLNLTEMAESKKMATYTKLHILVVDLTATMQSNSSHIYNTPYSYALTQGISTCANNCNGRGTCLANQFQCDCQVNYMGLDCFFPAELVKKDDKKEFNVPAEKMTYFHLDLDQHDDSDYEFDFEIEQPSSGSFGSVIIYGLLQHDYLSSVPFYQVNSVRMQLPLRDYNTNKMKYEGWIRARQETLKKSQDFHKRMRFTIINQYSQTVKVHLNIKKIDLDEYDIYGYKKDGSDKTGDDDDDKYVVTVGKSPTYVASSSGSGSVLPILGVVIGLIALTFTLICCICLCRKRTLKRNNIERRRANNPSNVLLVPSSSNRGNIQAPAHRAPKEPKGKDGYQTLSLALIQEKMPSKKFSQVSDDFFGQQQCSICLESFNGNSAVRQNPSCRHLYHGACIELWLKKEEVCPICKVSMNRKGLDAKFVQTKNNQAQPIFDAQSEQQKLLQGQGPSRQPSQLLYDQDIDDKDEDDYMPDYPMNPQSSIQQSQQQEYEKIKKFGGQLRDIPEPENIQMNRRI